MQFDNQKTRNVAEAAAKILAGETVSEELKGNQHKIDKNKNNKIDAEDFKHLRAGKKPAEVKKVCVDKVTKDGKPVLDKAGKQVQDCKEMKVHQKLEGTKVPEKGDKK